MTDELKRKPLPFIRVDNALIEDTQLDHFAKVVYLAMAYLVEHNLPQSIPNIMKYCGGSEKTIRERIQQLKTGGYLNE